MRINRHLAWLGRGCDKDRRGYAVRYSKGSSMKLAWFLGAATLLASYSKASPLELATFPTSVSGGAAVHQVLSLSPVEDGSALGGEISYEHALGDKWGWRAFLEASSRAFYVNPLARRVGGGIGLRRYWHSDQALSGLFLEGHGSLFNIFEPYSSLSWNENETAIYTMGGGGVMLGWQIPFGDHIRVTPAYRLDWLFADNSIDKPYIRGGRINGDLLLYLGIAF